MADRVKEKMGCEIIFTNKEMDEGYEIPDRTKKLQIDLLLRKDIYPYDWMDSVEKFSYSQLPPKEAFFSRLNGSNVSDEDYLHA